MFFSDCSNKQTKAELRKAAIVDHSQPSFNVEISLCPRPEMFFFSIFIVFQFCWYSNFYNLCLVGFSFPISQDYIELFVQMLSKFFRKIKCRQLFSFKVQIDAFVYLYSVYNTEIIALHKNCHLWLLRVDSKNFSLAYHLTIPIFITESSKWSSQPQPKTIIVWYQVWIIFMTIFYPIYPLIFFRCLLLLSMIVSDSTVLSWVEFDVWMLPHYYSQSS